MPSSQPKVGVSPSQTGVAQPNAGFWRSLRRVTTTGQYIPEIDGLRFVAILAVILYHIGERSWQDCGFCIPLTGDAGSFMRHLARGVPLFFAISGLVLGIPFARQHFLQGPRVRLGPYLLRRVTRLEPPYIINLLIRFPLVHMARGGPWLVLAAHLGASLLYLHGLIYGTYPMLYIPAWSLEVEVQFYLLAPLLAVLFFSKTPWIRRGALIAAIVAFSVLRVHTPGMPQTRMHLSIASSLQYFLVGFLLADWFLTAMPRMMSSWIWDVVGIGSLVGIFLVDDRIAFYVLPVLVFAGVVGGFKGTWLSRIFRAPVISTLGGMCYSLYLTHSPAIQGGFWLLARLHVNEGRFWHTAMYGVLISFPIVFPVGMVFYVLIERPCMDREWPRKLGRYLARA